MDKFSCPSCGSSDRTDKISKLYLETLSLLSKITEEPPAALNRHFGTRLTKRRRSELIAELRAVLKLIGPPEGKKIVSRLIHPDLTVACFGLISLLPLYGMKVGGSTQLFPSILVLVLSLGLYFILRNRILARHRRKKDDEKAVYDAVRRGIETWMRLERCADDGAVYDPESGLRYAEGSLAEQLLAPEAEKKAPPSAGEA
jgi:hypothetical protein